MALGLMQFQTQPETITVDVRTGNHLKPSPDYLMWALTVPAEQLLESGDMMYALAGERLLQNVQALIDDWHPDLRALVAASDPASIAITPIRVAVEVPPWETTNVTLLGDAIHAMSPSGGSGANTALRDAGLLFQRISSAEAGVQPLLEALHDYEAAMLAYGFDAVRRSEQVYSGWTNPFTHPYNLVKKPTGLVRRA
jgi:2-polyprenyl-6-methoxyphenol hydroxylase-like FAD-dependent oxidoreductase